MCQPQITLLCDRFPFPHATFNAAHKRGASAGDYPAPAFLSVRVPRIERFVSLLVS